MNIRLLHMKMENFMNYAEKEIDFTNRTFVFGRNGVGKSTIATAYNWCLFNCDYDLKDNPDVRRRVNGVSIGDVDVVVTLVLDVDGKEVTMRKVQKRTYGKDGVSYKDDNKYFVNEVPKTLKDFSAYLEVDMKSLLMCSNINAFLNQKPADMREFLFSTVGDVLDVDVAKKAKISPVLVQLLGKYSAEEIGMMNKKVVSDTKKELPVIDGQIKEKERDIQLKSEINVSDLELKRNDLKEQLQKNLEKQNENEKIIEESQMISDGILELKFEQSELKRKLNEDNVKERTELNDKISEKIVQINGAKLESKEAESSIKLAQNKIDSMDKKLEQLRAEWTEKSKLELDVSNLSCPYCRQPYPADKQKELVENFANEKAAAIERITKDGNETKSLLDAENEKLNALVEVLRSKNEHYFALEAEKSELKARLSKIPDDVDVTGSKEYLELQKQIEEKETELKSVNNVSEYRKQLKNEESELRELISECEKEISASDTEVDEKRLEELKTSKLNMVQKQLDAENILCMIDELNKAKNNYLSDSINSRFDIVRWELWELNKSGTYKNICTPTVDGKSILTTMSNKGNRILGKVDICRGIQRITGISAPIWLDDSESLDEQNQKKVANMVNGQLIMLIVNDEKNISIGGSE